MVCFHLVDQFKKDIYSGMNPKDTKCLLSDSLSLCTMPFMRSLFVATSLCDLHYPSHICNHYEIVMYLLPLNFLVRMWLEELRIWMISIVVIPEKTQPISGQRQGRRGHPFKRGTYRSRGFNFQRGWRHASHTVTSLGMLSKAES